MGGGGQTVVQAPAAPNYNESMRSILEAQVAMAPEVYQMEEKYQPLYNALQAAQQAYQAQQSLNIARQAYPQIAQMEADYNAANRRAELGQLQTALPAYQQAFNALTPGYSEAVAASGQLARSAMVQSLQRPQFASYQAGIRDPYGMATPAQFQAQAQPVPAPSPAVTQTQTTPAPQPAQQTTPTEGAPGKGTPPAPTPSTPAGNFAGQMESKLQQQTQPQPQVLPSQQPQQPAQPFSGLRETQAGGYVNAVQGFTPQDVLGTVGSVPTNTNMQGVTGPQLASDIQKLDQGAVEQYISTMPGMGQYANMLAQQSQAELAAGKSLTAEEQRIADQTARAAYAARGTALGNQAIGAEILNRADVANQRYQQRLQNAAQAAGTIQGIYQPALQQSLQRQQLGIDYGLGLQQQAFGQAQARDAMAQQIQQQRYAQLMGQQQLMQGAQEQAYNQAMGREQLGAGTQQAAFQQALQRSQADQQAYMAGTQAQAAQAALGQSAMSQLQAAQAPILQAFYKQPILQGQESQAQQMAMMMQQQAGPQYFNPESQTGMGSIYGAYNAQMNLAGASMQANAAAKAGKSGMFGAIGGGLLAGVGTAL